MTNNRAAGSRDASKFFKVARIFGAEPPDEAGTEAIPYDMRREMYLDYLREKGNERPTSHGKAMGVGAAVGGIPLALLGGAMGHGLGGGGLGPTLGGALIGGAAGAGLGALSGHAMQSTDSDTIDWAKRMQHAEPHEQDKALARHIHQLLEMQREMAESRRDSRNNELSDSIRSLRPSDADPAASGPYGWR